MNAPVDAANCRAGDRAVRIVVVGPNPQLAREDRRQAEARTPSGGASIASVCASEAPTVGTSGKGAGGSGNEPRRRSGNSIAYAALDLGTNNCRLLIARPSRRGFQVVDAFSRIIRLGEGIAATGNLAPAAMSRTREALKACAAKIARQGVARSRLVATEACRVAANAPAFLDEINRDLGLNIEILSREDEAKLAVCGCASLLDPNAELALVFDIGGGSSELIWLDLTKRRAPWRRSLQDRLDARDCIAAWTSLPVGVVTLSERFGGCHVDHRVFDAMVEYVTSLVAPFEQEYGFREQISQRRTHLLGTSGTVTTLAGVWLGLQRYDRNRVDGCWLAVPDVQGVTMDLLGRTYEQRVAEPCIGRDRADLVLAGCAILEALLRIWPAERLRVADRGLREGILTTLMAEDGVDRSRERR